MDTKAKFRLSTTMLSKTWKNWRTRHQYKNGWIYNRRTFCWTVCSAGEDSLSPEPSTFSEIFERNLVYTTACDLWPTIDCYSWPLGPFESTTGPDKCLVDELPRLVLLENHYHCFRKPHACVNSTGFSLGLYPSTMVSFLTLAIGKSMSFSSSSFTFSHFFTFRLVTRV